MAQFLFASYPKHAGRVRLVNISNVTHYVSYVPYGESADIKYQKYTKDYSRLNSRPYVTKRSSFASLESAVKSLINA
jgi:hypothetical protein